MFDTNVVLDLLLDRTPFASDAVVLFSTIERAEIVGYFCATTLTNGVIIDSYRYSIVFTIAGVTYHSQAF